MFVDGDDRRSLALLNRDRDDLFREASACGRGGGALLAAERKRVLIGARDAPFRRDVLGRFRHRVAAKCLQHLRVDEPPPKRGVFELEPARKRGIGLSKDERRPRHALDAAADDDRHLPAGDGAGRLRNRIEAGAAQAVDRRSGYLLGQPGEEERHTADVAVVFARLVRAAEYHVVYSRDVEVWVPCAKVSDGDGRKVVSPDPRQCAAVTAKGGSDGVADVDGFHDEVQGIAEQGPGLKAQGSSKTLDYYSKILPEP